MENTNYGLTQHIFKLWHTLTTPHATEVDAARQEYMTKVVSLIMGIAAGGLTLLFAIGWWRHILPLDSLLITLSISVIFSGGWWLADRGHWQIAGYFPVALMLVIAIYGNWIGGIGAPAMVLYMLAIALSATLQGARTQRLTLIISLGRILELGGH
ncbi:hypothetical protein U14_02071 [Candidatus Moduliflexus flocculans]|uniref:Uncharacterized protein n=1 Tax=Candidatus Moduliflexus flocculans TaxID=1499966 RepID=A0A0S6VZW4_9BACT|nr:hypothetical protein U14_02071 [Candidatus Moduliflexus flocculans]